MSIEQLLKIAVTVEQHPLLWDMIATKDTGKYCGNTFPEEMKVVASEMEWIGKDIILDYYFLMCSL